MIKTAILFILLSLLAVVAVCFLAAWLEKAFPGKKFDEMQMLHRYRSYRLAFLVGFLYYLALSPVLIAQVDGEKIVEPYFIVMCGILLQLMVVHTYCLIHHAALPLSDKNPLVSMIGNFVMGFLWLTSFRNQYEQYQAALNSEANALLQLEPLGLTGRPAMVWLYLAFSVCFFYMAVLHTIAFVRCWKE